MKLFQKHIDAFTPTSLDEMNEIKLLNRNDTKYIFHERKLPAILEDLKAYYKVLEIEGIRLLKYENQYFETEDFSCYQNHQRGRLSRTKIRIRKYVESDLSFIEIKTKTNKSRTVKNRIPMTTEEHIRSPRIVDFVNKNAPIQVDEFAHELQIDFQRITLAHKELKDRCTLDLNLCARWNGKQHHFENLIIAELKQDRFKHASEFNLILKKHKIYSGSFSKYCFSFLSLNDQLKRNNFKPNLRHLEKTLYD
ncbi:MAG: polyphosphate polymerase domain-containing protein [Chitinophagales bacterium]